MNNNEDIVFKVMEMLDTSIDASIELIQQIYNNKMDIVDVLITDLSDVFKIVYNNKDKIIDNLEHTYIAEMTDNVIDTINHIKIALDENNTENSMFLVEFQLIPFIRRLKESIYYWCYISKDGAKIKQYYENEYAYNNRNVYIEQYDEMPYKCSVVVVAYNNLDITKRCIESIFKYTDFEKLNAELILVNHGSTDGTYEYFKSLEFGKIINIKNNIKATMFSILPQICTGRYYIHVANDTVVTKDWLEILLKCIESDEKIALAVPATTNISNYQGINVPNVGCQELDKLAFEHNKSNNNLWFDRARVLPAIGIFDISIINKIGFWDPALYSFDFCDDDFSFNARRAGYRQVLCEDVWCYHQGSATVAQDQQQNNTLEYGKELFIKKHNMDPWGTGFCYNLSMVESIINKLYYLRLENKNINVLSINSGFGDTPLQIKNELSHRGFNVNVYCITTRKDNINDLKYFGNDVAFIGDKDNYNQIFDEIANKNFSFIIIEDNIAEIEDFENIIKMLSCRMSDNTMLILELDNIYNAFNINNMINFNLGSSKYQFYNPNYIFKVLNNIFDKVNIVRKTQKISNLDLFINKYYGQLDEKHKEILSTMKYNIICEKE